MTRYYCLSCGADYPKNGLVHLCPDCGGVFSVRELAYTPEKFQLSELPGMWRYRALFGLEDDVPPFYLGEGNTPLLERQFQGKSVFFKCEHLNPSGSFKDRQSAVLMPLVQSRGINAILEDSSGNAGASVAQYAAGAGVKAKIFIPGSSSGPKRQQIEMSGAEVVLVDGPRANAAQAVVEEHARTGLPYASHALLPFGLAAYASIAFEIYEKMGRMPGQVIAPIGHGSLFLGLLLGFEALSDYHGEPRPSMIGVQAENCAPVYQAWKGLPTEPAKPTLAEGTAVSEPVRAREIIEKLIRGKDDIIPVKEESIARSQLALAGMGLYVEPTAAMVWSVAESVLEDRGHSAGELVLILSGNGLKSMR